MIAWAALALAVASALRIQPADLPGIFWSTGGACPDGPELAARQCRGIRSERARALAGQTFVVTARDGALERSADGFTVRGCLDCAGATAFVTGGGVTVTGDRVVGPVVYQGHGALPEAARVDLFFRLDGAVAWTQEGHRGIAVALVGYRVYDACGGQVVAASAATPSDRSDLQGSEACASVPQAAAADPTPVQPTPADIKTAMDAVAPDVDRCFDRYGVPGTADVFVEIGAGGAVTYAETRGAFSESPTGACVASAVSRARFPRYARTPVRIHYPFLLR